MCVCVWTYIISTSSRSLKSASLYLHVVCVHLLFLPLCVCAGQPCDAKPRLFILLQWVLLIFFPPHSLRLSHSLTHLSLSSSPSSFKGDHWVKSKQAWQGQYIPPPRGCVSGYNLLCVFFWVCVQCVCVHLSLWMFEFCECMYACICLSMCGAHITKAAVCLTDLAI